MCVSCPYVYVDSTAALKNIEAVPALAQRLLFVWARVIRNTPPPRYRVNLCSGPSSTRPPFLNKIRHVVARKRGC